MAEQDIVTQKRMQLEDFRCEEFFRGVLEDHDLLWAYPYFGSKRDRVVCYGSYCENHTTDDFIHQLLIKDVLVAMVFERRTDFNFIEATYVVVAKGIRMAKHRLEGDYATKKHDKKVGDRIKKELKEKNYEI